MAASRYRIVLRGRLSERFESAFDGMTLEHGPNRTVLIGDVRDQAQLYGLIDRLQEFGIELLAVEPAGGSDDECGPGAAPVVSGLPVSSRSWCKARRSQAPAGRRIKHGCPVHTAGAQCCLFILIVNGRAHRTAVLVVPQSLLPPPVTADPGPAHAATLDTGT